ncbi:MAG: LysM peptidoglycan-binding domain-containing protein [Hungatella sp.]|nr:LysM peptidoglycan-binding domain-containing protein [Hungatella sp.]
MEIYVVQPDDTIDKISKEQRTNLNSIIEINQLVSPYRLAVGQALLLPAGSLSGTGTIYPTAKREIFRSGYAYPFISPQVLEETLLYLSEMAVFSYGFTTTGDLIPPTMDDKWMVEKAEKNNVIPTLTLTPLGADGRFNSYLVSALVRQRTVQRRLVTSLAAELLEKGFQAVNIDFEYVQKEDRDAFTAFVAYATNVLNTLGYQVSVALAPKYSDNQPGVLYEGMDYGGLGAAANWVVLMTYEWGYTYGPPMAVAPINQVRRVVEYALTKIPSEKICLGVPNYGYDWPLPYERGVTAAQTLGNIEAVQIAVFYGVPILFDETAKSPYFRYWQYGVEHEVWFEDVRSWKEKFRLVEEYGLRGITVWQLMKLFRAGWVLLDSMF